MPIHIHVDVALSARQKRILRLAGTASAVIGTLGVGVAIAAPKSTFNAGDALSAQRLNETLVDLDARTTLTTNRTVRTNGASSISVGGVYVARTALTDGRFIDPTTNQPNGYRAGKRLCEAAAKSATAHMCDNAEMIRSDQLGLFTAPLVANDENFWVASASGTPGPAGSNTRDCIGFTYVTSTEYATVWTVNMKTGVPLAGGSSFNVQPCTSQYAIACCD